MFTAFVFVSGICHCRSCQVTNLSVSAVCAFNRFEQKMMMTMMNMFKNMLNMFKNMLVNYDTINSFHLQTNS